MATHVSDYNVFGGGVLPFGFGDVFSVLSICMLLMS